MAAVGEKVDVLVAGAGIAGLTAAHHLREQGRLPVVVEASDQPGGRVRTVEWEGCRMELGAVYMASRYDELQRLAGVLGIDGELEPVPNAFRTAVMRGGEWSYADYGHTLNPVTRARDFARFGAVGLRDRLSFARLMGPMARVAAGRTRFYDLAGAARLDRAPIGEVISRDAARYYVTPLLEVFCGYRPEEVGLPMVAFVADPPGHAMSPASGMGTLPRKLAEGLDVRCDERAVRVEASGGERVSVATDAGEYQASAVVIATPADATLEIWPGAPEHVRAYLAGVDYSDSFILYVRTREPFSRTDPRGDELYMEVMPDGETLQAVAFANGFAPDGGLLVLAATADARGRLADEELAARLEAELLELHPELGGQITARRASRAPKLVPRFPSGRVRELAEFRATLGPGPVQLAGDYLYGACMESAAQAGRAAAERLAG